MMSQRQIATGAAGFLASEDSNTFVLTVGNQRTESEPSICIYRYSITRVLQLLVPLECFT